MLFDEIKIDTITYNDQLYINVEQLHNHILGSAEIFSNETAELAKSFGISRDEKYFTLGLIEGMWSVALMLGYGNRQYELNSVNTVEDLLKRFWNENRTDD
jgi:hypothetical protein